MPSRFLTILAGRNLPKIAAARARAVDDQRKTIADFTRVVEQTGILEREPGATDKAPPG